MNKNHPCEDGFLIDILSQLFTPQTGDHGYV
jgi:hypothetical protein